MTPSLNNGIFLRESQLEAGSHMDSYHLLNMFRNSEPTDMGPIDFWINSRTAESPLYKLAYAGGKNVEYVTDPQGRFKWSTPIAKDLPYIVEDIDPTNNAKGLGNQKFRIKLNRREFGRGDIITYDKFNGVELFICPDEDILNIGDAYIYTVELVNNASNKFLDNKFLKPGTKYFRKGSAKGENGEYFADMRTQVGEREFFNYVGGAEAHVEFSMSQRADRIARYGSKTNSPLDIVEIWDFTRDKQLMGDPSIASFEDAVRKLGMNGFNKSRENGDIRGSFLSKAEAAHMTKIANDIETYTLWGHGGLITHADGPESIRMSVGLWKQLDNAGKYIYNKSSFSMEIFRNEIYNFFRGRTKFDKSNPTAKLVIQTGLGGIQMVNEAIKREAVNAFGSAIDPTKSGISAISGDALNLKYGYAYTQYVIPWLAQMEFVINPAFDNEDTNEIENPRIDGFPLSSYSFIIFDVTNNDNDDNIKLLKYGPDHELKWGYQNGNASYTGQTQAFQSSGNFSGYRVFMSQVYPAIWVKDPTKVLKIVMKNPITGGTL